MGLLRIHCPLREPAGHCRWALIDGTGHPVRGEGRLADLPRGADRVQLVIPAADVLITRASLPPAARRRAGAVLAFAVEEETAGEPDGIHVSWLGSAGDADVLAVVDRRGLARWRDALNAAGIHAYEVHCETLLMPWRAGEWSIGWDGREGFVRTGELEGAATDSGDRDTPPLSLRLMLDAAAARDSRPASLALHMTAPEADAAPDVAAWQRSLGVACRMAESWSWRTAPPHAGIALVRERQSWRALSGVAARLKPAAWIATAALAVHAAALVADWTFLADRQKVLRKELEERFRSAVPDAVAVADPALQMRRKLAEARHAAGLADDGDFLPLLERVAAGMKDLPAGNVRVVSFESGRITLELALNDASALRRVTARLREAGLNVNAPAPVARPGVVAITVRAF
jgi:general secretion pathway protein L